LNFNLRCFSFALVFTWDSAIHIRAKKYLDDNEIEHYEIWGPFFFGSTANFQEIFDVANDHPHYGIVIDNYKNKTVHFLNKCTVLQSLST
jgi:SulP family sulfate permease